MYIQISLHYGPDSWVGPGFYGRLRLDWSLLIAWIVAEIGIEFQHILELLIELCQQTHRRKGKSNINGQL